MKAEQYTAYERFDKAFTDICALEFPQYAGDLEEFRHLAVKVGVPDGLYISGVSLQAFFDRFQPDWPRYNDWLRERGPSKPAAGQMNLGFGGMERAGELLAAHILHLAEGRERVARLRRVGDGSGLWRLVRDPLCPACRDQDGKPRPCSDPHWKRFTPICGWLGCCSTIEAASDEPISWCGQPGAGEIENGNR